MKSLFTFILTFALAGAMQAKAGTAENEKKAKAQVSKYSQQLLLSKDQQDKVYAVTVDFLNLKEAIMIGTGNEAAKDKALTALKEETEAKLKAILTAEQFAKLKSMREAKKLKKEENKATGK